MRAGCDGYGHTDNCSHLTGRGGGRYSRPMSANDHVMASEAVVAAARGNPWRASLNHFDTGGRCMVTSVQVGRRVIVVGQDDLDVLD